MSLRKETDQRSHIQTNSWASFSLSFSLFPFSVYPLSAFPLSNFTILSFHPVQFVFASALKLTLKMCPYFLIMAFKSCLLAWKKSGSKPNKTKRYHVLHHCFNHWKKHILIILSIQPFMWQALLVSPSCQRNVETKILKLLRLRAADVPLSKEFSPLIAPQNTKSLWWHWAASRT